MSDLQKKLRVNDSLYKRLRQYMIKPPGKHITRLPDNKMINLFNIYMVWNVAPEHRLFITTQPHVLAESLI